MLRNTYFKTGLIILTLLLSSVLFLGLDKSASALSAADWRAGNIIGDNLFYNGNDMTAQEVQAFLNSKVSNCSANATCLKNYSQTISGYGADQYCSTISGGVKSAAQIINQVASACGIGSKVLLVLLQKEQALVTNTKPTAIHYQKATGFACPDTAPCDSQYAGFFNQVYRAARQYKVYRANPNSYRYKARQNNQVLFHPNAACGSKNVYIENDATAGLYIYTPYQPNSAALNNMYGTGDGCSSYGNRNFWRLYSDWFGSPNTAEFQAAFHSQSGYQVIDSGAKRSIYFMFKNTGTAFWKDDKSTFPGYPPIRMAVSNPINTTSRFRASNWLSSSRATGVFTKVYESNGVTLAADQQTVRPGQIARFEFTIYANPSISKGIYRQYFQPIAEGYPRWNMGVWSHIDIGVHKPNYKAAFHSQSAYPTIPRGGMAHGHVQYRNTGTDPWFDKYSLPRGKQPIHLATTSPINRTTKFRGSNWDTHNRPRLNFTRVYESDGKTFAANQHVVYPGQIGRFELNFNVPANTASGFYREHFELVAEGAPGNSWRIGPTSWLGITVP